MPIDSILASGIIGAGASLFSNLFNTSQQGQFNREMAEWQEHMYERQRADNLADWHMMNEYNSPAAQMERYREAGISINPYLMYGNNASSVATGQPKEASFGNTQRVPKQLSLEGLGMLSQYMQVRRMEQEIKNMQLQNKVTAEEVRGKRYQNNLLMLYGGRQEKYKTDILAGQKDSVSWQNALSGLEWTLQNKYGFDKAEAEVNKINETVASIKESIFNMAAQRRLTWEQVKTAVKQREVMDATIEKIMQDTELSYQQAVKVYEEGVSALLHNDFYVYDEMLKLYNVPTEKVGADLVSGGVRKAFGGTGSIIGQALDKLKSFKKPIGYERYPVRVRKR